MLADDPEGKALVDAIDRHADEHKQTFVTGFARFVIDRGEGTLAPAAAPGRKQETWQAVGRRLYGTDLFNKVLTRELAARKETGNAQSGVPPIRSDQGEVPRGGQAVGGGKDLRGKDHKQPRRKGPASPPAST